MAQYDLVLIEREATLRTTCCHAGHLGPLAADYLTAVSDSALQTRQHIVNVHQH
jgi:hypothetical protein